MTKVRHPNIARSLEFLASHANGNPVIVLALDIATWLEPLGQVPWSEVVDRYGSCVPPDQLEDALDMLVGLDLAGERTTLYANGRRVKRLKWLGDT